MSDDYRILIDEENCISLRRASVVESDGVVSLILSPESSSFAQQPKIHTSKYQDWLEAHNAFLYQCRKSDSPMPISYLKHLMFETPPKFGLLWADSGHSVAVYLNGEPWAFIDEHARKTYSKGIMDGSEMTPWYRSFFKESHIAKPWNQKRFETIFADVIDEI